MPPEATTAVAPEPPRSKAKLWIIILVSVLGVAGATGAAVYFVVGGQGKEEQAEPGKKAAKKEPPKAPAQYVAFDPPFVVNFEAKGMVRFLQVSVEVMTRDPATSDLVKQHDPMLRNELLLLLGNQSYDTISTREGKERLRGEALEAIRNVIKGEGGDGAKLEQLYFTSFVMQ
jgi:flagellar protein FliL